MILATTPFYMSTAIQETGRAERDGKLAKCYIILAMKILSYHSIDDSWDLKGYKAIYDIVWTSTECHQLCFICYVNKGKGITCLQNLQNQICSWCLDKVQPALQTIKIQISYISEPLIKIYLLNLQNNIFDLYQLHTLLLKNISS